MDLPYRDGDHSSKLYRIDYFEFPQPDHVERRAAWV